MFLIHLDCTECAREHAPVRWQGVCTDCGAPLQARYDLGAVGRAVRPAYLTARPGVMWRYRELLPLRDPEAAVTLGEGGTPLLPLPSLGRELGLERLLLKDEAHNPTGSFKARGMSVAVSMARALGATTLAAPSAGNAGGALAAYGARAGLPVVLALPEDTPAAHRLEAEIHGARVHLVAGTIADCGRWIAERAAKEGWTDLSTLKEPYRVEGKKTLGLELAEQLGWELPDVILYPTGGGTGLVGMAKAFAEMRALGWINSSTREPRFYAVQAAGCAPIAEAFAAGADRATPPRDPSTVAAGLRVPSPIGDRWMLRVVRASKGAALTVTDDELLAGARRLARAEGIFPAPEAGALIAALAPLIEKGDIGRTEQVVLLNTGSGLKYAECWEAGKPAVPPA